MEIKKPQNIETSNYIWVYLFVSIAWGIVMHALKGILNEKQFIPVCVFSSLIIFSFSIYYIATRSGQWFNPAVLFLLSFYIFQNGQFLLMSLDIPYNTFYFDKLKSEIQKAVVFSSASNLAAGLSGMLVYEGIKRKQTKKSWIDGYSHQAVEEAAWSGFVLTASVAIPVLLYQFFSAALSGGYSAFRQSGENIPAVVGLISFMFVPFSVLCLTFLDNGLRRNMVSLCVLLWSVLMAFCGNRTSGLEIGAKKYS